jgi:hypothetical protein
MSGIEFPSVVRDSAEGVLPRHPHRQIAELLAAVIPDGHPNSPTHGHLKLLHLN